MNQKKYRREDFARACELYEEWNAKINVISRKDIDSVFEHHFLHSFSIFEYLISRGESTEGLDILDVGDVLEEISELCRKFGLSASQITAWPISNWLSDDYFAEKFVIEIRK